MIPVGSTLIASVFFFVQILTDQLRRAHPDRAPAPADSSVGATLRSILVIPTDYGVLCGIFVLFAWQSLFAAAYALLLIGTTLFFMRLHCLSGTEKFETSETRHGSFP